MIVVGNKTTNHTNNGIRITKEKEYLNYLKSLLHRTTPKNIIIQQWQTLDSIRDKINRRIGYKLSIYIIIYKSIKQKLDLINPNRIMERGFSLVMKKMENHPQL
jgi:exonuclease VII large subunit